jgi:peptidoglycan hydrolase CwlO-like protein
MSLDEFTKNPIEVVISFVFILTVVSLARQLPSLLAKLITVIQNNTNIMEMLVKTVDNHERNSEEKLNGLSTAMTVLTQQQKSTQKEVSLIHTNVIGVQTDVQVIKDNMVTRQELHNTVDKLYERGEKY